MANLISHLVLTLVFTTLTISISSNQPDQLIQSEKPAPRQLRPEKQSHLRFYWHDIYSGRHPTAAAIVRPATNTSVTGFGSVSMIDDPLTVGPELTSKLVGRAQGLYASASIVDVGLMMAMNLAFIEGKYNGSTLAVLGRNAVFSAVREMPIVGGSGLFRFARGYVQARTHSFDMKTGDATVQYNVFVNHY